MSNSFDENFLQFYRSVKNGEKNNELKKFINYSFLHIYLHIKGRTKYSKSYIPTYKRVLFSLKEKYQAKRRLNSVLKDFSEKELAIPINVGFYILDESIFSYIKKYEDSFEKTTIKKIIQKKIKSFKCVPVKKWFPLDTRHDQILLDRYFSKYRL